MNFHRLVLRLSLSEYGSASVRSYSKFRTRDSGVLNYLKKQTKDPFAKDARRLNYRARSAFKLIELNERFRLIKKGSTVLDVGAAPGSWCQVLSEIIFSDKNTNNNKGQGYILGVDLQPMVPIEKVDIIAPGDITQPSTQKEIQRRLGDRFLDAVVSDMAPNPTGSPSNDHERIIQLCRTLFLLLSPDESGVLPLRKGGNFLCKIWDGSSTRAFVDELSGQFKEVRVSKPEASRDNSAELYIIARGYK